MLLIVFFKPSDAVKCASVGCLARRSWSKEWQVTASGWRAGENSSAAVDRSREDKERRWNGEETVAAWKKPQERCFPACWRTADWGGCVFILVCLFVCLSVCLWLVKKLWMFACVLLLYASVT